MLSKIHWQRCKQKVINRKRIGKQSIVSYDYDEQNKIIAAVFNCIFYCPDGILVNEYTIGYVDKMQYLSLFVTFPGISCLNAEIKTNTRREHYSQNNHVHAIFMYYFYGFASKYT